LSKIVSIGTAVPDYCHQQSDIMHFMQNVYATNEVDKRKMRFLYGQSGIKQRYSVIPDYSREVNEWKFYPHTENLEPFPSLEQRMAIYNRKAPLLSVDAIRDCLHNIINPKEITHLITVSCTGMSAPGLDLQLADLLDLNNQVFTTSVNFMGCYAAIHALKIADAFCNIEPDAKVVIVCTELSTIHFQREPTMDNIAASLLFGDGSAAVLVTSDNFESEGLHLENFYRQVIPKGRRDMSWELSSSGFLMTLSGYIPDLIEEDFGLVVEKALQKTGWNLNEISDWNIHPGGKRILEAIQKSIGLQQNQLEHSYQVLSDYGNMSSATLLFVLKEIMKKESPKKIFSAGFGPGLTIETFTASSN
jgi:predicted naringenin-chalcone synthase